MDNETLNNILDFWIYEYDNYDIDYQMDLNFAAENVIECKIISGNKTYFESEVTVNFTEIKPF